jgi:Phosphate transport regulator (distant homolog of PhoU)
MFRLKPKENKFFVLFSKSSRLVEEVTNCLSQAMNSTTDLENILAVANQFEQEADSINDQIIDELKKTFITPLDREDLFSLANLLDDFVDQTQEIIERMYVYQAKEPIETALQLSQSISLVGASIVRIFDMIEDIHGNQQELLSEVRKIVQAENDGDRLYRQGMAKLFSECKDPIEIIKWKEILEHMEDCLDHGEKMGDVIRGVVMKYA